MDLTYFQRINNTFQSKDKQNADLYLLNRHVNAGFTDSIDYHLVRKNCDSNPLELLIIKDATGNPFKKKIKSRPSEYFNLGDYILWNNQIWMVSSIDPDDKTYNSGHMRLCTICLRWQNSSGTIVDRWCYTEDFSKAGGVEENKTITTARNQYEITLPVDLETKRLKRDQRFPIDFEDAMDPDVYKLTNRKILQMDSNYFSRGGLIVVSLSYDAFNNGTDKHINLDSGEQVWICNYIAPTLSPPPPSQDKNTILTIDGRSELKVGHTGLYRAIVKDADGNEVTDLDFEWHVVSDFADEIEQIVNGNLITLKINNHKRIANTFLLQVSYNHDLISEINILIEGLL